MGRREYNSYHSYPEYCELSSNVMASFRASLGLCFISLLALQCCHAGMFVMLPSTGKSHFLLFTRLAEELTQRGHKVG